MQLSLQPRERVEVKLSRSTTDQDSQKSIAKITVSDSGIGNTPKLRHIFDHFQQADGSGTRQFGGLKLAIVRHRVELQGSTARAESQGKGQPLLLSYP